MTIVSKIMPETKRIDRPEMKEGEEVRRRKKKRSPRGSLCTTFLDMYKLTGESLGEGSYGKVETCVNVFTGKEYAVKIIQKVAGLFNRSAVLQEIELYHLCRGKESIIQLVEFFDETDCFYLVFEKMEGGTLLNQIQQRGRLSETEAASITRDLARALSHLHSLGVAHRDIKPDNVLCVTTNSPAPVKLCDFDLCSVPVTISGSLTPSLLSPVGSLEYMAPEVVGAFLVDDQEDDDCVSVSYTKACDLWSLGVLLYTLLCGCPPFIGHCSVPDCGWDQGDSCSHCQSRLFSAIRQDTLTFPSHLWGGVSSQARQLITGLLVREAGDRFTADQVLAHPWILQGGNSQESSSLSMVSPSIGRRRNREMVDRIGSMGNLNTDWNMRAIA